MEPKSIIHQTVSDELAKPKAISRHEGDGYTEPHQSWVECECGSIVWVWQQFYSETDEDPRKAFDDHVEFMVARALERSGAVQEWEYGITCEAFPEIAPEPHATLEAALHVQDNTETIYRKWTAGSPVTIHRRRKTGPWEPVDRDVVSTTDSHQAKAGSL